MSYTVTFGANHQRTKHNYGNKRDAINKAKSLRKNLPGIRFGIKKTKR